jgi:SAM-dependent methyltransferase
MTGSGDHRLRRWFVRTFWASHNDSSVIRRAIAELRAALGGGRGLHLGCGDIRLIPHFVNLDLQPSAAVDVCGDALRLPFPPGAFDLVLSQEMVEHLPDPFAAVREMARVLRSGGVLYLQAPFVIGYHPGPEDYWRFTRTGLIRLVEDAGMKIRRSELAVGPGTGFYRICVEFTAGAFARLYARLYLPVKAIFSVGLYPLKWLDPLFRRSAQADRIAGGFFVIADKP